MNRRHFAFGLMALCLSFVAAGSAASQEKTREERMAQTLHDVCVAGMTSGQAVSPTAFGDVLRLQRTDRDGVSHFQQARGQPWVRVRTNRLAPGTCVVMFDAGQSNITGVALMSLLRRNSSLARVTVPRAGWAYAPVEYAQSFDSTRDPHMQYFLSGGSHWFVFDRPVPPPPT